MLKLDELLRGERVSNRTVPQEISEPPQVMKGKQTVASALHSSTEMNRFPFLICMFAFATDITADTQVTPPFPFALAFSSTTISVSRIDQTGYTKSIKFSASYAYRHLYQDALRHLETSTLTCICPKEDKLLLALHNIKISSVLQDEIDKVNASLTAQLQHVPGYAAVYLPPIFDSDAARVAHDMVFPEDSDPYPASNYGSTMRVACYGFDFLQCKQLGRSPEDCNDDGPETLILVLVYEEDYLHVGLADIYWEYDLITAGSQETCIECGERWREVCLRPGPRNGFIS